MKNKKLLLLMALAAGTMMASRADAYYGYDGLDGSGSWDSSVPTSCWGCGTNSAADNYFSASLPQAPAYMDPTPPIALYGGDTSGLHIAVLPEEDSVNIIKKETAVKPVVEVTDKNNIPFPFTLIGLGYMGISALYHYFEGAQ